MKLSIVATLYCSASHLNEFYQRISSSAKQLVGDEYEIILVNDGSPDNSLELAERLVEMDSHVVVVDLSRNFGHHKAMMTGLSYATGELIFLIDSDLEEEPEWLLSFAKQLKQESVDMVHGVQLKRKGKIYERVSGWLFYRLFRFLTRVEQPDNITTARLMTRRYVDALLLHRERELNIGALWIVTGFKQCQQPVHKHATSLTTYSFSKKLSHFVNAVTSFSGMPLIFTFYSGFVISFSAFIYIVYLLIKYYSISSIPGGYSSIIVSIWFFSGLMIFFIGLQGIYISKLFLEVKQRPYTIIRHVYKNLRKEEVV